MVGGELTMAGLDLVYDPNNKYYEAPFQMKANGGMFLVDDFGQTVGDLEGGGLTLASSGSISPGNDFAYFDCQGPGFSVIEILGFDEGTRGFMEMLRQQGQ